MMEDIDTNILKILRITSGFFRQLISPYNSADPMNMIVTISPVLPINMIDRNITICIAMNRENLSNPYFLGSMKKANIPADNSNAWMVDRNENPECTIP